MRRSRASSHTLAIFALAIQCAAGALPGQHNNGPSGSYFPLIQALVDDNITAANLHLEAGADPNALDVITPLYACQEYVRNSKARHVMLRKLIAAGALPDAPTQDGTTTLMLASYHGDMRSAQILLKHGADPLKTNHMAATSINAARKGGHHELAEMLKEHLGESGNRMYGSVPNEPKVEL